MNEIFFIANDLIQTIDTARSIHYTTTTTDSTAIKRPSDEENETTKAGVFLVDKCFSVMNAAREKCKTHHRDGVVEDGLTARCYYSGDKFDTDRQEDRGKIKLDNNNTTMLPGRYRNDDVLLIAQQFDHISPSRQFGDMSNRVGLEDDNGEEYTKFKCLERSDTDDEDGRKTTKTKKATKKRQDHDSRTQST